MSFISQLIAWFSSHKDLMLGILGAIVVIDHALAAIPSIAASSTYQGITALLDKIHNAIAGKKSV